MIDLQRSFRAHAIVRERGEVVYNVVIGGWHELSSSHLVIAVDDCLHLFCVKDRFFKLDSTRRISAKHADLRILFHRQIFFGRGDLDRMQAELDASMDVVQTLTEKVHTCACGWVTPYPITVTGTYECPQCVARRKLYG
jgi:hypothetical protein